MPSYWTLFKVLVKVLAPFTADIVGAAADLKTRPREVQPGEDLTTARLGALERALAHHATQLEQTGVQLAMVQKQLERLTVAVILLVVIVCVLVELQFTR
jgi:hypothetical protein